MNYNKYFNEGEVIKLANHALHKMQIVSVDIDKAMKTSASLGLDDFQLYKKIEDYLKSIFEKVLGLKVRYNKSNSKMYILLISFKTIPTIYLNKRLIIDLMKVTKNGESTTKVTNSLKDDMRYIMNSLSKGEDPFELSMQESFKKSYIVFEVEAPMPIAGNSLLPAADQGTLASFKGVLPVEAVSLVDTDGDEKSLIPKEVKKDHFVLKPTKEQLQRAILKNILNTKLTEKEYNRYAGLIRLGNIKIIKENLTESIDSLYRKFTENITISKIYYK